MISGFLVNREALLYSWLFFQILFKANIISFNFALVQMFEHVEYWIIVLAVEKGATQYSFLLSWKVELLVFLLPNFAMNMNYLHVITSENFDLEKLALFICAFFYANIKFPCISFNPILIIFLLFATGRVGIIFWYGY